MMPAALELGPLSFPTSILVVLVAVFVGGWRGGLLARRAGVPSAEPAFWRVVFWALVASRVVFVARYHTAYLADAWTVLDVRDGGFDPWGGLAAAWVLAGWLVRRRGVARGPMLGAVAGMTALGLAGWGMLLPAGGGQGQGLPALQLKALDGQPVALQSFAGRPVVLNLWATWCPHCVREMPVLAAAQQQHPELAVVFADQGEDAARVQRFLQTRGLASLQHVLLDPGRQVGQHFRVRALPTTLFFGRDGQLVEIRIGAVSQATLQARIERLLR